MSTLEQAISLAATLHAGQIDKAGARYILHPLRVMLRMTDDNDRIAAVLHDVIEDCNVTPAALLAEGFSPAVVEAIECLTKLTINGEEEAYDDFIRRVAQNAIARRVKLADLADNMDLSRIPDPTAKDFARVEKYRKAKLMLESLAGPNR